MSADADPTDVTDSSGRVVLDDVDELCRLASTARRLGCRIHLLGATTDLRDLIDLAGVGDVLGECPADRSPEEGPLP